MLLLTSLFSVFLVLMTAAQGIYKVHDSTLPVIGGFSLVEWASSIWILGVYDIFKKFQVVFNCVLHPPHVAAGDESSLQLCLLIYIYLSLHLFFCGSAARLTSSPIKQTELRQQEIKSEMRDLRSREWEAEDKTLMVQLVCTDLINRGRSQDTTSSTIKTNLQVCVCYLWQGRYLLPPPLWSVLLVKQDEEDQHQNQCMQPKTRPSPVWISFWRLE